MLTSQFIKTVCRSSSRFTPSISAIRCSSSFPPNSSLEPSFITNRNPRNLEKLRIGEKPAGWLVEKKGKCFWLKLDIELSAKHISARIVHFQGHVPVKASTKEFCINQFLYGTKDVTAAHSIGRVLAHRCLQAGITEVAVLLSDEEKEKTRISAILRAMEEGGIALEESPQYLEHKNLHHPTKPEKGWTVFEEDLKDIQKDQGKSEKDKN